MPFLWAPSQDAFEAQLARHEVAMRTTLTNLWDISNNHFDLETQVLEVVASLDELTTAANDHGRQFREYQREVYNAHKRVYNPVVILLCVLTCLVTYIVFKFGWVFYKEAIAEQARVDAGTARVAYLKELWPVHAFFQRDWVMTVAWAEYYHIKYLFKAWFS